MAAAASCSSSNPTLQCKYDVFLSFRGEDTRNIFTSHLYAALRDKAIHTFIDDNELERGEEISPALLKAIEESKISIIILSENYASSSWCLDELLKILECRNTNGQLVVPVFYRVDPSDVRKQTGSFREAFDKHELGGKLDKVHKWRVALTDVANLAGHPWEQNRPDSRLVHDIVEDIMMKLDHTSFGDFIDLVGIDSRIEQILPLLRIGLESACIAVGIWGMGGIGKTTIARAIFNQISNQFEDCCFLENVREVSKKSGVDSLRKELLAKILKDENIKKGSVSLESTFISNRLGRKKVLIVLDDVDDSSQLESIIGRFDQFGRGSRIIITTRNKRVLKNEDQIYEVEKLNDHEALRVFSLKAFEKNSPTEDFMELSKRVVNYADGIPLALKVLGSFLLDRNEREWKSALDRLEKTPNRKIQEVLRISYDGLNQMEMDIFCDIACFFKGWDKDHVMTILDGCGLFPDIGISVLVEKSLITISDDILCMHDLLQEMGLEIVREVSKEPGQRSRLWNNEDVLHMLTNKTGTGAVEGICLDLKQISEASLSPTVFEGMCNLRILKFCHPNYIYYRGDVQLSNKLRFPEGLKSLSNKLSYLQWFFYPLESFPLNFHPENLVELDLSYSKVKRLWEGTSPFFKLKVIKLECCKYLIKIPDLSKAPNLEHLHLCDCQSLHEVPDSLGNLLSLKELDLECCSNLKELPDSLGNLSSLRELHLQYCSNLKELPDSLGNLSSLRELHLQCCSNLKELPDSLGNLSSLRELHLQCCSNLKELPDSLGNLSSLRELHLRCCPNLKELPDSLGNLSSLRELNLQGCSNLKQLRDSLGNLSSLRSLYLSNTNIVSIPASIKHLSQLTVLYLDYCKSLQSLPELPSFSSIRVTEVEQDLPIEMNYIYANCLKLDQNSRSNIEADAQLKIQLFATISQKNCLDGWNYRPAFEFVYPGSEIPEWFSYRSEGSLVTAQLPLHWGNSKFLGFALCAVVVAVENNFGGYIECKMKTYNGKYYGLFRDRCHILESEHIVLWYTSCLELRKKFGDDDRYRDYNGATFQFHVPDGVVVKKCGVHRLYAQDEDECNLYMIPYGSPNENFGFVDQGLLEPTAEGCNDHNFCCDEDELNGSEEEPKRKKMKF